MFKLLTAAAICVGVTALSLPLIESATERASARQEPPARAQPGGYKSLTLDANPQGHFHVETVVNGRRLEMLADTGATKVVLTAQDAARIGIRPRKDDYTLKLQTANGVTRAAPVTLKEVRVGAIRVRDVKAIVAREGALGVNLLGMSFIGALKRFEMKGERLTLVQ